MEKVYDIIIIGLGSMGSAACYYASKSGLRILGLDQYNPPHFKGSHSGGSRIIRKAYFEHPDYVPLLELAYQNWSELEQASKQKQFHKPGLIYFGLEDNILIDGVQKSANKYNLPVTKLSHNQFNSSHPQFSIPEDYTCLLEENAGYINTARTIQAYHSLALKNGVQMYTDTKVSSWNHTTDKVQVHTDMGSFSAGKLIICAGAWTSLLIKKENAPINLRTTRQSYFYFEPRDKEQLKEPHFPCWNIQDLDYPGLFYGFPYQEKTSEYSDYGLKIAHHYPIATIDPEQLLDKPTEKEEKDVTEIFNKYIPGAAGKLLSSGSCIYTNSEDENFIVDYLDNTEKRVVLACGFSGHGFKFVPAMGELLSRMAIDGIKAPELDFLSTGRFSKD